MKGDGINAPAVYELSRKPDAASKSRARYFEPRELTSVASVQVFRAACFIAATTSSWRPLTTWVLLNDIH